MILWIHKVFILCVMIVCIQRHVSRRNSIYIVFYDPPCGFRPGVSRLPLGRDCLERLRSRDEAPHTDAHLRGGQPVPVHSPRGASVVNRFLVVILAYGSEFETRMCARYGLWFRSWLTVSSLTHHAPCLNGSTKEPKGIEGRELLRFARPCLFRSLFVLSSGRTSSARRVGIGPFLRFALSSL